MKRLIIANNLSSGSHSPEELTKLYESNHDDHRSRAIAYKLLEDNGYEGFFGHARNHPELIGQVGIIVDRSSPGGYRPYFMTPVKIDHEVFASRHAARQISEFSYINLLTGDEYYPGWDAELFIRK